MEPRFAVRFWPGRVMPCVLVALLTLACARARGEDKAASPDFSKYPQTEAFRSYLDLHTNSTANLRQTNLMVISTFPNGAGFADEYFVSENGWEFDLREVYDWAHQASHSAQLSETNLVSLRSAIHDLPATNATPPVERLVVVSFHQGTNWITHTYDSDALPKPMRQIYDIVGERFESKQQEKTPGL